MDILNAIREYIVENILFGDGQGLEADTSFQESGILDSTGFLEVITFVEERFGIEVGDSEVVPDNFGTLSRITSFVTGKLDEKVVSQSPS